MQRIRAVIFDLDDTLINTASNVIRSRKYILDLLGLVDQWEHALKVWRRLSWYFPDAHFDGLIRAVCQELHADDLVKLDLPSNLAEKYLQTFWDGLQPAPSAVTLLEDLTANGYLCGILSNGSSELQHRKLAVTGLLQYFSQECIVVAAPHTQLAKPHPDGIHKILQTLEVPVSQSAMVGDRKVDIVAGRLAQVAITVQLNGGSVEANEPSEATLSLEMPDYHVQTLADVYRVLCAEMD